MRSALPLSMYSSPTSSRLVFRIGEAPCQHGVHGVAMRHAPGACGAGGDACHLTLMKGSRRQSGMEPMARSGGWVSLARPLNVTPVPCAQPHQPHT